MLSLSKTFAEISELPDWVGCEVSGVDSRNGYGDTPLHVAAVRDDAKLVTDLLEAGAEVDAKGEHGFTPLHEALTQGNEEAARVLIVKGASLSVTNDWGDNALKVAMNSGRTGTIILVRDGGA